MGKRTVFNYYMGLARPEPGFEQAVINEASRLAGGCTVTKSDGYWVHGADIPQFVYKGELIEESCFNLQFSVEPIEKCRTVYVMRCCIRQEARKHQVDLGWVHVTTHEVDEHHFQIKPGVRGDRKAVTIGEDAA